VIDVIVPVYRPGKELRLLLERLSTQSIKPAHIILAVTHDDVFGAMQAGELVDTLRFRAEDTVVEIVSIDRDEFSHSFTRNFAAGFSSAEFLIFMTQDAVPKNDQLLSELVQPFADSDVALVYARQIARRTAALCEKLTRKLNYPAVSMKKTAADIPKLGIKTYFCSNACAAYRKDVFDMIGGFGPCVSAEDMLYAAEVIAKGKSVYYQASAQVFHSHDDSLKAQWKRYFEIGLMHGEHPQYFLSRETRAEKTGASNVVYILRTLLKRRKYLQAVSYFMQCVARYAGYWAASRWH
jgi:rhamnosyltransferase